MHPKHVNNIISSALSRYLGRGAHRHAAQTVIRSMHDLNATGTSRVERGTIHLDKLIHSCKSIQQTSSLLDVTGLGDTKSKPVT